jgi:hypothetical protein
MVKLTVSICLLILATATASALQSRNYTSIDWNKFQKAAPLSQIIAQWCPPRHCPVSSGNGRVVCKPC